MEREKATLLWLAALGVFASILNVYLGGLMVLLVGTATGYRYRLHEPFFRAIKSGRGGLYKALLARKKTEGKLAKIEKSSVSAMRLDSVLRHVHTPEQKSAVIVNAVEKGLTSDPEHLSIAMDYYESQGRLEMAAQMAVKMDNKEKAIQIYEKQGRYDIASKLAAEIGDEKRLAAYKALKEIMA